MGSVSFTCECVIPSAAILGAQRCEFDCDKCQKMATSKNPEISGETTGNSEERAHRNGSGGRFFLGGEKIVNDG